MVYAATHIILAIIIIELFRKYYIKDNNKFPRHYILLAAFAGLIPDLDIAAYYVLYFFGFSFSEVHRTFLHTIFVPLILFLIAGLFYTFKIHSSEAGKMHMKLPMIFFILGLGATIHLIVDTITGPIMFFYPFSTFSVGYDLSLFLPEGLRRLIWPIVDGLLVLFWLTWMNFKLKVRDYF